MNATPLVLLVEDDLRLAELVRTYLQGNGFRVVVEHRGDRVVEHLQNEAPDLVVLDLGLPGRDGFAVCKELRAASDLPILIVTARDNDIDHVVGLELGADDYVVKPVEPRVLVARIHALLRRARAASPVEPRILRFGELTINATARSVAIGSAEVALSSNEFDLLFFLACRAGEIQSRETLYLQLYKREYDGLDRTLDVRISHLRKKLGDAGCAGPHPHRVGPRLPVLARRLSMTRHFLTLYLSIVIVLAAVSWGQERLWQSYGGGAGERAAAGKRARSFSIGSCRAVPTRAARGFRRRRRARHRARPRAAGAAGRRRSRGDRRASRAASRS